MMKGIIEEGELQRLLPLPFGGNGNDNIEDTGGGRERIIARSFTIVGVLLLMLVSFRSRTLNGLNDTTTSTTVTAALTHLDTSYYDVVNIKEEEEDDVNVSHFDVEEEGTTVTTKPAIRVPTSILALSLNGRKSAPALSLSVRKSFMAGACTGTADLNVCGEGECKLLDNKDICRPGRQEGQVGLQSINPSFGSRFPAAIFLSGDDELLDGVSIVSVETVAISFLASVQSAVLVGGEFVLGVIAAPFFLAAAAVASIGAVIFGIFESLKWQGIADKDARCHLPRSRTTCDGQIVFNQWQVWNEQGTGNVHLWSNSDSKDYDCSFFQCSAEHTLTKWNPDTLDVDIGHSAGLDPLAQNTIAWVAKGQYSKDFKAKAAIIQTQVDKSEAKFTRVQLNMYVENYLYALCRNHPEEWIPCAKEGGDCLCPMGTVKYGVPGVKWAPKEISNTWTFAPLAKRCDAHSVNSLTNTVTACPLWAPHQVYTETDGSYGCYQTERSFATCPDGYVGGKEGICTAHSTKTRGKDFFKKACEAVDGGYWNPYLYDEYNDHAFTCYLSNFYCSVHSDTNDRPDVTECNCDPYFRDHTMRDFISNNPYPKYMMSDSTFALQVLQMAQAGGANNHPSKSDALVKCTVANFGSDPQKGQPKICQCKRTTCDYEADAAAQRVIYKEALDNWARDCTQLGGDMVKNNEERKLKCCVGLVETTVTCFDQEVGEYPCFKCFPPK